MKNILLFVIFTITNAELLAQNDSLTFKKKVYNYAYRFLNDSVDEGKPKFLLYPVIAYSPETSLELGFSGLYLYNAKGDAINNRLSEIQVFTFYTLKQQYGAWFDHFIYGDKDNWFFLGRLRFQRFPLFYYGLGPEARKEDETVLDADYTLIKERVLRRVATDLFVGLEIDYQRLYNVSFADEREHPHTMIRGADGTSNLGLGAGIVYDNRKNALNVRQGAFAELAYIHYDNLWGSEYGFNTLQADLRLFRTVRRNQVLAFQMIGASMRGEVPFNQYAQLGGDSHGRGYYTGRFRDQNYFSTQIEYRWLPFNGSKRFGGVVFASIGTVAPEASMLAEKQWHPAAGLGLRFLVFPKKDIFIRADFALTPEGTGIYLYTGEAF